MDMESVSNPRISPDGSKIVYTRGWVDKVNDRRESSLYMMNADGSRKRALVDDRNQTAELGAGLVASALGATIL